MQMRKEQMYDKRIGLMVPTYPNRFTTGYKGIKIHHDGHGALSFAVGPRMMDMYDENIHHTGTPLSKNDMVTIAKQIIATHPDWVDQAETGWGRGVSQKRKKPPSKTATMACISREIGRRLPADPDERRQAICDAVDECVGDAG